VHSCNCSHFLIPEPALIAKYQLLLQHAVVDPEMPEQSVQEEEDYDGRTLFPIRRLTNLRVRVSPLVIEIIIST
jgi:hypothetical protein